VGEKIAVLTGNASDNIIDGTAGDDLIRGYAGDDRLNGFGGDDDLRGGAGRDYLYGGDGNDILNGGDGNDLFVPGLGDTTIIGGAGSYDRIFYFPGDLGASSIHALITDSTVEEVNSGRIDTFTGVEALTFNGYTSGDDIIDASALTAFSISVQASHGNDTIYGGSQSDFFQPGSGNDSIDGGGGSDILWYTNAAGASYFDLTITDVSIVNAANGETDTLSSIERLHMQGTSGDDIYDGSGWSGDAFWGGSQELDSFIASSGNDQWSYYNFAAMEGDDTITGFASGETLDFSAIQFNEGLVPVFIGLAEFTGSAGQFRYEKSGGQTHVQFDKDGDGVSDWQVTLTDGEYDLAETFNGSNALELSSAATLTGTTGDDVLVGTPGDDVISGLGGDDRIEGLGGTNTLEGDEGSDELVLQEGSVNTVLGGAGYDYAELVGNHAGYSWGGRPHQPVRPR
jgi:Ca2+-binding RTX toxin-like protein